MDGDMGSVVVIIVIIAFLAARRSGGGVATWVNTLFWVSFCKFMLLALLLGFAIALGPMALVALVPVAILLFMPSLVLRRIIVPLGWPRFAYWVARCSWPMAMVTEHSAGASVYGALALARGSPLPQSIEWLQVKIDESKVQRGAALVAAGLLAALRGDRQQARSLLLMADMLHRKFIPSGVRVIARDWLVADAARIGNWPDVIRLGLHGHDDTLRWSHALARIGARLIRDPQAWPNWALWLCWAMAPRRRATLPLLRRALLVPRATKAAKVEPAAAATLPDALADLARVLDNAFAHDGISFAAAVGAVDAALDDPVAQALADRRLRALGTNADAAAVISGLRTRLVDSLVPLIEESPRLARGGNRSGILDQAVERVRHRLFRDVEAQCKDYDARRNRDSYVKPSAEWETWARLRNCADRLLELAPDSELALFRATYVPVCNFAVYQHNTYRRLPLAHDMYSWLHRHAHSDPEAIRLLVGNMKASES
jgi:hypothetical protein